MYRFILILLLCTLAGKAQTPFTKDYYLNESSTPVKVNAMAQDKFGYIWLGTSDGVYCYNGNTFNKIQDSLHSKVTALTASGEDIWVGYANGKIGYIDHAAVSIIPVKNVAPSAGINCLKANKSGVLWAGTEDQGLFAIINNTGFKIDENKGLSDNFIYTVSILKNGHALLGTDNGINNVQIEDGKIKVATLNTANGLPDNIVRVIKQMPSSGLHIIGTQESGIALYDQKKNKIWVPVADTKWTWGQVNDILPLSDSHVWVATEDGYLLELKFKDSISVTITPKFLPGKKLKKLLLDKSGNIWIATDIGLTMVTAEYLSYIPLNSPYLLRTVSAIAYGKDRALWFAQGNDLYTLPLNDSDPEPRHILQTKAAITSIFIDTSCRIWIGTLQGLLYKEPNSTKLIASRIAPLTDESILSIAGTDSNLWIAGLNGVEVISYPDNKGVTRKNHYGKNSGIGSDYVYQLYPDKDRNMWMATDGAGVCMYNGEAYRHWNAAFKTNGGVAYTITQDVFGNMWAGAFMKDLYVLHNNTWENVRKQETHNIDINISSVIANGTGQVISVYQRCIDEWYPKSQGFRHFNSRMHIGIDSTSGIVNCVTKDNAGNVYVPFEKGIAIFTNQDRVFDIRPLVHISKINQDQQNVPKNQSRFNYNENYFSFHFNGINYTNPERLNYRYMLRGYNNDWINTNDETVIFPQLPPGNYTFRVQASLNSEFNHAIEDSYSFTIALPLWREPWFIVLVVLGCFGLVYLYVKLREKQIKNVSLLKQERIMFEYEHLKSQVNPHFLFNSLNTLTSLIDEDKDTAISYTEHLSDLYRNMLTYRNHDLVFLSEEWEILSNYIHIQKSRFGDALQLNVNIPDKVMKTKKIVPLALQLLVENAIKHNVVSNSEPLVISIDANDETITVRNFIRAKISKEKGAGLGLNNIRNRYGLLTHRKVIYSVNENEYIVTLPLL